MLSACLSFYLVDACLSRHSQPPPQTVGIGVPVAFVFLHYLTTGDRLDLVHALLTISLTVLLTGIITDLIKVSVGRPRPDFYYRCFPDGQVSSDLVCLGEADVVEKGRKSFPSGHSAWAFSCGGFLSLYLSGKLHLFGPQGRGQAWRLCAFLTPLLTSCVASLTRLQDHKHHWEDVVAGCVIGVVVSLLCYLQYYPSPLSPHCDSPLTNNGAYHLALWTPHTRKKYYATPPALNAV
ncbi:Phospholipid phosphatase 5 [Geodia barretti]|uniref:Phospholipid phosphatase 5 n=1 Tax=Geodia barretti TaxID=519541 RepID=A0AA35X051_GEOBA|nr:Phospholipid phosphatase 5 [Geodia barretti]